MDLFSRREFVVFQTLLAQGVGIDVSISYLPPGIPIPFAAVIGSLVLIVTGVHYFGVFLAVALVGKERTAWEATGFLRFDRHVGIPPLHKKSPYERGSHIGLAYIYFSIISISQNPCAHK